ncbi:hypothetical protein AVENLUH5627_01670 [Acinetobacter venetianus]|uniref:Outer membrane assembly lipoprotein YfiO n=1 Tax=Acinetobacter venetianus TaxID=52133 RepID=A0A150HSC4_9GAMM|nr:hypothetical protein [Acinetobacter venetianus]KXZ69237.1 hypothetical protein AVENLUH5627_01670 [Acinetobacter venetianus]
MNLHKNLISKAIIYSCFSFIAYHSHIAYAGADITCEPDFAMNSNEYQSCSNLPILYPANDNQTNMLLLLSDSGLATIAPLSADLNLWDAFYGSVPFEASSFPYVVSNKIPNQRKQLDSDDTFFDERCATLSSGKQVFNSQVKKQKLIPENEKQILIQAREKVDQCGDKIELIAVDPNWSVTTRQYASYLNASILFYKANYAAATKIYTVLATVEDTWLKETSQYMLIRTSLNTAYATGMNQYGDVNLDKINAPLIKAFLDHISTYLKAYPNGQYVASARGFMRRGFWLAGRQDLLINEIVWQIQNPKSKFYNLTVNQLPAEVNRRIFESRNFDPKQLKDPFFLATYDLMYMRKSSSDQYRSISWNQLNAQKPYFKDRQELFQYLQATHLFFIQNKAKEALSYLPQESYTAKNYLQLSQIFLRGQILEKTEQKNTTEAYWGQLLAHAKDNYQKSLFETALSNHLNAKQDYSAFIGKTAKISQANLQRNFITQVADAKSLQAIIQSDKSTVDQKQAATFTLLSKSLIHQDYALFKQTYAYMPKNAEQYQGYNSSNEQLKNKPEFAQFLWNGTTITPQLKCNRLETLITQLISSPKDPLLNVCLGEYIRSEQGYSLQQLTYGEKQHSSFSGQIFARGQVYKDIIKSSSKGDLQAYALYRAVHCYAPSGINDCNDAEVSSITRKNWFDRIKKEYPNTSWAKSLKYYW